MERGEATNRAVLVVGGGPAGMQAALLLAAADVQVYLVERAPAIGGHMPMLDKTFPTDSCGLCFMSPRPAAYCPFVECERSERITVMPSTELLALSGEPGNFTVRLLERSRGVDADLCTGCGRCSEVCPSTAPSELGGGLELRKAIYRPYPQAVPDSYLIDWTGCTRCGECVKACPTGAIRLDQGDAERTLQVAAVILATGFKAVDAALETEYGFGLYPNVVTSIQMERMLSRGGPSQGVVQRPSDRQQPSNIAFIQCVGSRNPAHGHDYCSSVCCMQAAKQTALLQQRAPEASVVVFHLDRRSFGKGYDSYVDRLERSGAVEYRRSAVSTVKQIPQSRDLLVSFVDADGVQREEQFSLVVLSAGVEPSHGVRALAERLDLPLNPHGFLASGSGSPVESPREGVFVAGGGRQPMDVADASAEGAAAAAGALRWVGRDSGRFSPHPDPLPMGEGTEGAPLPGENGTGKDSLLERGSGDGDEEANANAAPQVAVLLCDCGGEIGGSIDLAGLAGRLAGNPGVLRSAVVDRLCEPQGAASFKQAIEGANRVVVGACAQRRIEDPLGRLAAEAGLGPGLLELVNLREQCSWVHQAGAPEVEAKGEALVAMGLAKAFRAEAAQEMAETVAPTALVVGGGAAGLSAASTLAEQGIEVWVAEREETPGGEARVSHKPGHDFQATEADGMADLLRRVEGSHGIHLLTGAEVRRIEGHLGSFRSTVVVEGEEQLLEQSVVLLATGVEEVRPDEYLLGRHPGVMTLSELEQRLAGEPDWARSHPRVAMILCAGSLEAGHNYCSRSCCSQAIDDALRIKESNPEAQVYLLHREMRSYGFQEGRYEEARRAGIFFLRYFVAAKPEVDSRGESLQVVVREPHLGQPVAIEVDALALAVGVRPKRTPGLAESLGVDLDGNGFFVEANVKVRSTEARRRGVFLAGSCQAPRSLDDTRVHAQAAAMRAVALLRPGKVETPSTAVAVNERICSGCGLCVDACAYGARVLDEERNVSTLVEVLCQGCGACAAVCPNGATQQRGFSGAQMVAVLDAALD